MSTAWIAVVVALWVVVILLTTAFVGTLRRIANVLEAAEERLRLAPTSGQGLLPGAELPWFEGLRADGTEFSADDIAGSRTMLLFLGGGCPPCRQLAAELSARDPGETLGLDLLVVLHDLGESQELALRPSTDVLLQPDGAIADAFQTTATPHAFVIENGTIAATGHPNTLDSLVRLSRTSRKRGDAVLN